MTWGRVQHGFEARPDLCGVDCDVSPETYLGHFFVDSLVHNAQALKYIVDLYGANRVCMGSDYPFPLGEEEPGALIAKAGFDLQIQEKLLAGSALEWLGRN